MANFHLKKLIGKFFQNSSFNINVNRIKNTCYINQQSSVEEFKNGTINIHTMMLLKTSDPTAVTLAVQQLKNGYVIAVPTDTVYGLACNANNPDAIKELYNIKGRNDKNPVAICVSNVNDLKQYSIADHLPDELLDGLLPGAVTVLLHKSQYLNNPYLNPGVEKIGIRIPNLDFIRRICAECSEFPIALTSANRSGEKSTLSICEFKNLWASLGAICDGGRIGLTEEQRAASTIVDLSRPNYYKITRCGIVAAKTINLLEKYGFKNCD